MGNRHSQGYSEFRPRRPIAVVKPASVPPLITRAMTPVVPPPRPPKRRRPKKKKKRRTGLFRRARSASPIRQSYPVSYRVRRRNSFSVAPNMFPIAPLRQQQPPVYPAFSSNPYATPYQSPYQAPYQTPYQTPYNAYGVPPYTLPPRQPFVMPQNMGAFAPPLAVPQPQPIIMPQEIPRSMFSPFQSSPYSAGAPMSPPYMQNPLLQAQNYYNNNLGAFAPVSTPYIQPQGPPIYNNIGVSTPAPAPYMSPPQQAVPVYNNPGPSIGVPGPTPVPNYSTVPARVITDWTRGGVISPGFLGPPI